MFDPNKLAAGLRLIAEAFETQEVQEPQTEQAEVVQRKPYLTETQQSELSQAAQVGANVVNMYGSPVPENPPARQTLPAQEETPQVSREALMAKLQDLAQTKSNEAVVALIKTVAPGGRFSEVPETLYGMLYQQAQEILRGGAA